ncbi:MAG: hypothetical protein RLZZ369_905 [Pseudomonadota bacterium]|jgi:lysophospholipase L1-like esterase
MQETLIKIALGPVLLLQGVYTRQVTPKLPEPEGARHGTTGQGPALRVLILGDSAAAGVGVDHQSQALTGQLVQQLAAHHQVSWTLLAQTGHNTQQVLAMLQQHPDDAFDVAVVSVGVNDVTSSVKPARWIAQQQSLIDLVQQRFGAQHIVLSPVPPMHRFPALPQPLRWFLGQRAHQLNRQLQSWSRTQAPCTLLQNDFPMQPDMMAADGFHPSAATYKLWADNVAQVILARRRQIAENAHR